uniref:Uncharacterized protein n=1 Tax=Cyphia tortilis TaxID=2041122 RepID=A0A291F588_9ASTR|nr:hypothetical protein Cyp_tor1Pt0176 [Cyphia tortilis]ATG27291.1 hypothetical protein Cyp_tor1Pt0176 [Cyphia tortilis]
MNKNLLDHLARYIKMLQKSTWGKFLSYSLQFLSKLIISSYKLLQIFFKARMLIYENHFLAKEELILEKKLLVQARKIVVLDKLIGKNSKIYCHNWVLLDLLRQRVLLISERMDAIIRQISFISDKQQLNQNLRYSLMLESYLIESDIVKQFSIYVDKCHDNFLSLSLMVWLKRRACRIRAYLYTPIDRYAQYRTMVQKRNLVGFKFWIYSLYCLVKLFF